MRGLPIIVLALASCSTRASETDKLTDQLIIDCVGAWDAGKTTLKFWGNRNDYRPDFGEIWKKDREAEPFQYFVDGKQMHLWLEYGRTRQTVDFDLVTTEDSTYVLKYELRFKSAVVGAKVYRGVMAKSFNCEPRNDR